MEESRKYYRKYYFLTWKSTSSSSETWQKMEMGRGRSRFQKLSKAWKIIHTGEWRDRFTKDIIQNLSIDFEGACTDPWRKEDVRITYMQKVYGIK